MASSQRAPAADGRHARRSHGPREIGALARDLGHVLAERRLALEPHQPHRRIVHVDDPLLGVEHDQAVGHPVDGEVASDRHEVGKLPPEDSVWENLTMPAQIAGRAVTADEKRRALETLALLGLDGLENKNANQLSGGQKQRVAIGRALMNRPKLILADEPTGNLDTGNTAVVYELFRTINKELGTTFLIVTHDRKVAQQTDRILEVLDGELVQDVRNDFAR